MSQPASGPATDALVFAGGDPPPEAVASLLADGAFVIAADSGLHHARALGRHVDLVVGDLDSVDPVALADAEAAGTDVERHPAQKGASDLELALEAAQARGARRITVVGGHGGRVDHFLANALLLASSRFADSEIDAWIGSALITVIRSRTELHGTAGSLCTLLAVGGVARGVTTSGLLYPLDDDELLPGSTRGVSNELTESTASVAIRAGALLAVQPHALEDLT
ncbi:MAG: thiamine diphosphokinase [Acidimicrobiia bacterium]